jgi:hypothetical protein
MLAVLAMVVGVLNFAAGDPGLDYAIAPTAPQLSALGVRLAHDLRAAGAPARHIAATCDDAACARRVGAAQHVARVVFSSATRHMAMIWSAQASVVDVASGRVCGPYDVGYKGDYDAIAVGVDTLAGTVLPAVDRRAQLARKRDEAAVGIQPPAALGPAVSNAKDRVSECMR